MTSSGPASSSQRPSAPLYPSRLVGMVHVTAAVAPAGASTLAKPTSCIAGRVTTVALPET